MDAVNVADHPFQDVVTTESELRRIIGPPNRWMTGKILTKLPLPPPVIATRATETGGRATRSTHLPLSRARLQ
jgi:hypothetical protein